MKNAFVWAVGVIFIFSCLSFAGIETTDTAGAASALPEMTSGIRTNRATGAWMIKNGWLGDRVICVDGLKLFQTVGPAFGYGNGQGMSPVVSTVQLYEERNGKVVPAKCQ